MLVVFIFILGLFIGSFLGVLVDRIPKNETVLKGRSRCDFCKKKLKWYDLIPVFSFIFLKGKCRYCKHSLSLFYPIIEITTGIIFVSVYLLTFNLSIINLVYYLTIASFLIVIFFSDLKYEIIPDKILFPAIIVSLFYLILINPQLLMINFAFGVGAFLFFLIISFVFSYLFKKDAMGGGDIKLVFLLGLFLGYPKLIVCLYLAFLTGALAGIILIIWKKKSFRGTTLPFGPFLILATIISLFWGDAIYLQGLRLLGLL